MSKPLISENELDRIEKRVRFVMDFSFDHEKQLQKANDALLGTVADPKDKSKEKDAGESGKGAKQLLNKRTAQNGPNRQKTVSLPTQTTLEGLATDGNDSRKADSNTEEYRKRLHQKIEELRALRGEGKARKEKRKQRDEKKINKKLRLEPINTKGTSSNVPQVGEKILFSRIDFDDENGTGRPDKVKAKVKGKALLPKNPKQALAKLEQLKSKQAVMKAEDQTRETESITWVKAIQRAQGHQIKDDPKLLKKSIDRKARQKKKSKTTWKKQEQLVQTNAKLRQEKRTANIEARKEAKLKKKMKKRHK